MRAAEVYLNYAEAKAELGTLKQEDLDISINKIRERAKMPDLNLTDANSNPDPIWQLAIRMLSRERIRASFSKSVANVQLN